MRNTFLLIYVVVSFVFSGISQEKKGIVANDSLKALLDNSKKSYNRYRIKESLGYAIKAANYAHELNADREIALAYYFITINYSAIADYESSKVYSSKALKYAKLSKQKDLMAGIYNNMGIMYADAYKDLKLSLAYYKKSKDIFCEEDNDGYTIPVINIARTYIFMKDYDKAYPYMEEYKELLNSIIADDVHGKCLLKYLEGQYFTYKNDIQMAKKSYSDAMYLAIGHCFLEEQLLIYEARSEMYESIGDIDNAYQDIKAHKKYQSAFLDKEKLKQIQIAKVGFSVDEYERELEVAKKEKDYQMNIANNNKTITFISIICFILLLGIVFFYYNGYKSKKQLNYILTGKNRELENAKIKADKLTQIKSQFISTVSHELRTPLYGVIGITSLLLEEEEVKEEHKKLLSSLKFSGDYLLNLVNNVLQISKIESNKVQLRKTPTNLYKLSQDLLCSFNYQAKNKKNELIFVGDPKLQNILLNIDSLRLSEILVNLIGNATKFTDNGKIWLRIKVLSIDSEKVKLQFEIEDNGIGIPENKKEFVFKKFSQVDRELDRIEGTGLGLSIVKNLLKIMNSKINLESEEGKGSKFYFDMAFEIVQENPKDSYCDGDKKVMKKNGNILVVEDNKINQIVTQNLLNLIGYDCTIVENGINSVKAAKNQKFSLILMDLNMPFLNGYEATKLIREFDSTTPIIALTASELEEVKEECMAVGMNDIINKPLNKNDLYNAITKNLISKKES